MSKRSARSTRTEPYTPWNVELPQSLTSKVELLLLDPTTGKIRYAARQKLTEQLLREWLAKQQALFAEGKPAGFDPARDYHPDGN